MQEYISYDKIFKGIKTRKLDGLFHSQNLCELVETL